MKLRKYLVTPAIVMLLSTIAFGQAREISEAAFTKIQTNAENLLRTVPYRLTLSMEYFADRDKPGTITRTLLREAVPPNMWRTVEEDSYSDGSSKRTRICRTARLFIDEKTTGNGKKLMVAEAAV